MINPRDADHAVGLELQIEELVEQRQRAHVQGRQRDVGAIDAQLADLYAELADSVERAASTAEAAPIIHPAHTPSQD